MQGTGTISFPGAWLPCALGSGLGGGSFSFCLRRWLRSPWWSREAAERWVCWGQALPVRSRVTAPLAQTDWWETC